MAFPRPVGMFHIAGAVALLACGESVRGMGDTGAGDVSGASSREAPTGGPTATGSAPTSTSGPSTSAETGDGDTPTDSGPRFDVEAPDIPTGECRRCSANLRDIETCEGERITQCGAGLACNATTFVCDEACKATADGKSTVGCEYYPTYMQTTKATNQTCFAAIVANTWHEPAELSVRFRGADLDVTTFAYVPQGLGANLSYAPLTTGTLAPAEVAILFLAGPTGTPGMGTAPCPRPAAFELGVRAYGSTIGDAFQLETSVPVVAYQINPYGGGSAAVTGSSLLIPTSGWGDNYIAVNAYADAASGGDPSLNIVASQDGTEVTLNPVSDIAMGLGTLPSGPANTPITFTLDAGQHAQFTQAAELTGSVVQSNKPVGLLGGHTCMQVPSGVKYCDHGEEMIPPVQALGHRYAAIPTPRRGTEPTIWRLVGAVDGTSLSWSTPVGGPASLNRGQVVEFSTLEAFVVAAQDSDHPFLAMSYMSSAQAPGVRTGGYGDPEIALGIPVDQYAERYVFFADPTYPETALTLVRARGPNGFEDVHLDCVDAGGWMPIDADHEWTRVQLLSGDFQNQGACSAGRREAWSDAPFAAWLWAWGTPETPFFTMHVSYGYPVGMLVRPINDLVIPPAG